MPKTAPVKTLTEVPPVVDNDQMYIEYMPLSDLVEKRHAENPKDHDGGAIARSMDQFGYTYPVLLNEQDDRLLAGHGRIDTLTELKRQGKPAPDRVRIVSGEWMIPVIRGLSFPDALTAEAYLIADNQLTILGGWKEPALLASLQRLQADNPDLFNATGFDADDVRGLMLDVGGDGSGGGAGGDGEVPSSPAAELQKKWQVERGQLWRISDHHKLLCGDATEIDDVARLMAGQQARCMWTDPPYGVEYVGKTEDALTIENDGAEGLDHLLLNAFRCADTALCEGAAIYVAHPAGALSVTFGVRFLAQGWRLHQTLVWVKNTNHYRHEPILFGYKSGGGRRGRFGGEGWYGDDAQTSVLEFDRPTVSEMHPTSKPQPLVEYCLMNSSIPGDVIYDPFGGSGTTMAACEGIGRSCRMLELDPNYAAVILERMLLLGLTPELVAAGGD